VQGLKQLKGGKALQGGDSQQVGGEFLFEPVGEVLSSPLTPAASPYEESKQLGEEKRVTWCHRMKNTRDHAEIPELREILGLDGVGIPGKNGRRWSKALGERKGTGMSALSGLHDKTTGLESSTSHGL